MSDNEKKESMSAGPADENRLMLGVDKESVDAEDFSSVPENVLHRWVSIFFQLMQSHRFTEFLQKNYVIQDRVDPEAKTIETLVVESPIAVGPPLSSTQLHEIQQMLKLMGCSKPDTAFKTIMSLLGQEGPTIELA